MDTYNQTNSSSSFFDPQELQVFKKDRSESGDNRQGVGVIIAIRKTYCSYAINITLHEATPTDGGQAEIEQVWATLETDDRRFHIGAMYIPPGSTSETYLRAAHTARSIVESSPDCDFTLLLGDFNCHNDWTPDAENPLILVSVNPSATETAFYDTLSDGGLAQVCQVRVVESFCI